MDTFTSVALAIGAILLTVIYRTLYVEGSFTPAPVPAGRFKDDAKNKSRAFYDVAIVGAGPSGSTAGYCLAKGGAKALLLEKRKFPRDKYCGDAVCKTAIEILKEMGVLDQLMREGKAHVSDSGGFVSPSGLSYIGRSKKLLGETPAAIAVKRTHLDEAIAMAARKAGADLKENHSVTDAKFDSSAGLWTVYVDVTDEKTGDITKTTFTARVLLCADGAQSVLARHLGHDLGEPQGICSRAFVKGGTHDFKADGVVFYNGGLLPGYAALFRHPNNELNYCCYLIPGNPDVTNDKMAFWHNELLRNDAYVKDSLGKRYEIEQMRAAPLRLGGIDTSYDNHLLIVGDAAGMIDPMTGEGIHHAVEGGKIAAEHLLRAIAAGNYSQSVLRNYQEEWKFRYGNDFKWSMSMCQILYRNPILLDAAAAAVARKGDEFMIRWADIMTGRAPKTRLLRPEFAIVIGFEVVILAFKKIFGVYPKPRKVAD